MNKVINFNTAAGAIIGENTRLRVRIAERDVEGSEPFLTKTVKVLEVRPTTRTNEKKHISMLDLRAKGKGFRVTVADELVGDLSTFRVEALKHGWLALVPAEKAVTKPGEAAPAGGSVTER